MFGLVFNATEKFCVPVEADGKLGSAFIVPLDLLCGYYLTERNACLFSLCGSDLLVVSKSYCKGQQMASC